MFELGVLAIQQVSVAVFHAIVHIAGQESFESAKLSLHKRILRNHDVTHAVRESFVAAVNILEKRCLVAKSQARTGDPGVAFPTRPEVQLAFTRLRSQVDLLFPIVGASELQGGDEAIDLVTAPNALDKFTAALVDRFQEAPSEFKDVLRDHFAEAFRFAFTEIGLKRNEAVRSVITLDLLSSLTESSSRSEAELQRLRALIPSAIAAIERQEEYYADQRLFQQNTTETLSNILGRMTDLVDLQRELIRISQNVGQPKPTIEPLAYVSILDKDGYRLAQGPIRVSLVTIGRDPSNVVLLPDRLVSRHHAVVKIEQALTIQDLQTVNGTYVNGDRVVGSLSIDFGDQIRIGPFSIEFTSKDSWCDSVPAATAAVSKNEVLRMVADADGAATRFPQ